MDPYEIIQQLMNVFSQNLKQNYFLIVEVTLYNFNLVTCPIFYYHIYLALLLSFLLPVADW